MAGPAWIGDFFGSVMLVVAAYSLYLALMARRGDRTHADINVMHVVMGVTMAGMLIPDLSFFPAGLWEAVFGVASAWFAFRCVRFVADRGLTAADRDHVHHVSHYATHLIMGLAMIYMYAAPGGGSMSSTSGAPGGYVGLPLLFLFALLVSGLFELDGIGRFGAAQLSGPEGASAGGGTVALSATRAWSALRLESVCHVAMCVTMGYMLVLML